MGLTETEKTIAEIPFPTVIICLETKATSEKIDVISAYQTFKENEKLSEIERSRWEVLLHICEFHDKDYSQFKDKFTNKSIYDTIQNLAISFNDTLTECSWQFKTYKYCELLTPILTADGVCVSFNALNSRDVYSDEMAPEMLMVKKNPDVSNWSMETGYTRGVRSNDYPIRVFSSKKQATLTVYIQLSENDLDLLCYSHGQGYKVTLNTPYEAAKFTSISRRTYHIPVLEQVDILVKPTLTYTSQELRKYTPSQRKCYYTSERPLRFFKHYGQNNCLEECLANFTEIECGCVKFSMPRTKDTKICGTGNIECYQKAEWKLLGDDVIDGLTDQNAISFRKKCRCLPACTTILYDAEVDRATMNSYKIATNEIDEQPSRLTIRFKDLKVVTLERTERYTFTHFLSICGGLLGLFLGVSALSIIEFIYYTTLRLFWTIRLWKTRNVVESNNVKAINNISVDSIGNDDEKNESGE